MRSFSPADHPVPLIHQLLLSGVAPRPIALVASRDAEGNDNLSPFSYYNAFGANPPVIAVSPAYRATNGIPKHTFLNIVETGEFTVSAVSYSMVEQISLASSDYERGIDEFIKAGFTKRKSDLVNPPGVAEAPFIMECRLLQHVDTGGKPGAGNLLIAEVLMFHIKESVFENDVIDPRRLDLVARMGRNWYCRANGDALFELAKPRNNGVGVDQLPEHIRLSTIFTGNDLAKLAGVATKPDVDTVREQWHRDLLRLGNGEKEPDDLETELRVHASRSALLAVFRNIVTDIPTARICVQLQRVAQRFLAEGDLERAWACALMSDPGQIDSLRMR